MRRPLGPPPPAGALLIQGAPVRWGDRIFRGAARGSGILILVIMGAIAAFLVWRAIPAFQHNSANFFTTTEWFPDQDPPVFGIAALAFGTLMTAAIAMVLAVPVGYGIALFIAFYANSRLAAGLAFITDLLAAVPSIIFGLWGLSFLQGHMAGLGEWLDTYLGWCPLFANDLGIYTKSITTVSAP